MCLIPLRDMNSLNSELVKEGPLSVTIFRGMPWFAKTMRSFSIVLAEVIDCMI